MMKLRHLAIIGTLMAMPLPGHTHHGVSGQFDTSQTVELSGTNTRIRLANPHSYLYFDVTDEAGQITNMRCELQSGSLMKRRGWMTERFVIGSQITIIGSPDRTDPTTCAMNEIVFENGVTAKWRSSFDHDGNVAPEERETGSEDGTPNIAGSWAQVRAEGAARGRHGPPTVSLTAAGTATAEGEGATQDDSPRFNCQVTNTVLDWWFDQMVNLIEQSDTEIKMTCGFMDLVRSIHLDGSEIPANFARSHAGYSMGAWDGDTLVVTTTGSDEGWIMAPLGSPRAVGEGRSERSASGLRGPTNAKNSAELTVTERFTSMTMARSCNVPFGQLTPL